MQTMTEAKETIVSALSLYGAAFPRFIWRVVPIFALSLAIGPLFATTHKGMLLDSLSCLIDTAASAIALAALLRTRFPDLQVSISLGAVIRLALVELYVVVIVCIGLLLLVFPAFWAASVTFLAPVFALAGGKGPTSAVSESAKLTKGHLRTILPLVAFCVLLFAAGEAALYFLPTPVDYLASLIVSVAWLYDYAVLVVVFARLNSDSTSAQLDDCGGAG